MQLRIKFFIICCFVLLFGLTASTVHANAPVIKGHIQIKDTHAPVSGVWVQWRDSKGGLWYTQTDANGDYTYPSWGALTQAQRDQESQTKVDITLSGDNSTLKSNVSRAAEYGCGENYHYYSLVIPKGMSGYGIGTLVTIAQSISVINGATELTLPTLELTSIVPPSLTPSPSPSPTPTPTSSPTPTPTINAVCACDGVSVAGSIEEGGQITVSGKAMVTSANSATSKVNSMTYRVAKNGQTISTSSPISVIQLAGDGTKDSYQSTFSYTIPTPGAGEAGSTVRYLVDAAIQCGTKTSSTTSSGAQTNTQGLVGFIRSLFGLSTSPSTPTPTIATNPQIQDIQAPDDSRSLQLGTFSILTPTPTPYLNPQCSSVEFDVKY